jgi:hypothetical protein
MFVTSAEMRHPLGSALYPGHEVWHMVQIPLATPLVLARIRLGRGVRDEDCRTYLCDTAHFAAVAGERNVFVLALDLLLPAYHRASPGWELHPVHELWQCDEPDNLAVNSYVLRTEDRELADSIFGTAPEDLKRRVLLYWREAADRKQLQQRQRQCRQQ